MKKALPFILTAVLIVACASARQTGANATSGAVSATGGNAASGAVSATGGNAASGAVSATGGNAASGAVSATGGNAASGAVSATGGNAASGAVSATGATTVPGLGPRANLHADPAGGIYVSPSGDDAAATGAIGAPYKSINTALSAAGPGDTLILRGGTYREGANVRVRVPNITIKSMQGELAIIDLTNYNPGNDEDSGVYFDVDSSGGKLQSVEVKGGFYAVCLETKWDWGQADRSGASNIIIEDCILHDSRYDVVKIKPNCDNVVIRYNEIYNSGRAFTNSRHDGDENAEGIDNVNGNSMTVQNNYIHEIISNAIYAKGGARDALIENNLIENAYGAGIMVGFDASPEFFDQNANPEFYENIRGVVRNNLIIGTGWEGIGLYAAKDAQVYNNTLVNVDNGGLYHSAIYFGITMQDWESYAGRPASINPDIHHNIVSQPSGFDRQMIEIRYANELGGLPALKGNPAMSDNCYYVAGKDAAFTDNRPGSELHGARLSAWQSHINGDAGSFEADPALGADYVATNPRCAGIGYSGFSADGRKPDQARINGPAPSAAAPASATGQLNFNRDDLYKWIEWVSRHISNTLALSYWPLVNPSAPATQTTPAPQSTPRPSETPAQPTPAPSLTQPQTTAGAVFDISDFYSKSGKLQAFKGDIIIVGKRQYTVEAASLSIEYWPQNTLDAAISWWTSYMDGYAESGAVRLTHL